MSSEHARAEEAFLDALELPAAQQRVFLEQALRDAPTALAEALSLLDAHESAGDFLESTAAERLDAALPPRLDQVTPGTRIGRYVVEGVLGTGGSGRVFLARQERPSRHVALKFLGGGLVSAQAVERFQDEAELLARLRHAGVAHVYEAGVHDLDGVSVPFLALELVEGAQDVVTYAQERRLSQRARVELAAAICDAVHHGHQKGVLHLDVKPANVLVDDSGRVKVIDFGIGHAGDPEELSRRGVVGTVSYMSPEQAAGAPDGLDVRADVYSLCALAFELLAGQLPIDVRGAALDDALRRVRDEPPRRASDVDATLRGELDAILAHALRKDREERYGSASALAADLRRFLRHEPVSVIPLTLGYQLRSFARRRRLAAASLAGLLVACVVFTIGATVLAQRAERRRVESEMSAYVADVGAAAAAIALDDVSTARERLESAAPALRGWEWRHLVDRLDRSARQIRIDASRVVRSVASADRSRLAVFGLRPDSANHLWIVRATDGRVELERAVARANPVTAIAFAPEGDAFALGMRDGTVDVVSLEGDSLTTIQVDDEAITDVLFAPDGGSALCALRDGTIRRHSLADGMLVQQFAGHVDRVIALAIAPDGTRLASGGRGGEVRIWDLARGTCEHALRGHTGSVECVAWSDDGSTVVSGGRDGTVRFWDGATGECRAVRREHRGIVRALSAVSGTPLVASGSWDRTLRLWETRDGSPRGILRGHEERVVSVGSAASDRELWSMAESGSLRFWHAEPRSEPPLLTGHEDRVTAVAVDPTGRLIASAGADGRLALHDLHTLEEVAATKLSGRVVGLVFTAADRLLATGAVDHDTTVTLPRAGVTLDTRRHSGAAACRLTPDGRLVLGTSTGVVRVIGADRQVRALTEAPGPARIVTIAAGPSTGVFALAQEDGIISSWSLPDMERLSVRGDVCGPVSAADIAPGGRQLAVGTADGEVLLLDLADLTTAARLKSGGSPVAAVRFSPNARRLASAGRDGLVRLWDVASGREVARLSHSNDGVLCLAWSPDGSVLAAGGGEWESPGVIALWCAPPADASSERE